MKLEAEKRTSGKPGALRESGRLPGVVYNKGLNVPVSVATRAFDRVFRSQGVSSVIDLDVDGQNHEVLVKAVQMDKRRRVPLHVDFYAVTAGQVVDVHVPIEFVGTSAGAKAGGQLDVQRREVYISVIPRLIPQNLEVDISALEIGDAIHISDIVNLLPPEAEILDELERTIITVLPPRLIEEVETAEEEVLEPEVIGEETDEDEGDGTDEDEA